MPSRTPASRRLYCELGQGIPIARGSAHGYYVSRRGSPRMLVVDCVAGDRIQISGASEIVILDVGADLVKLCVARQARDA
jgi:hypothetical protein